MRRPLVALATGVFVVAVAVGGLLATGRLSPGSAAPPATPPPTATATVQRRTLQATTQVNGTLGYADTYTIGNGFATSGGADPSSLLAAYAQAQAQYDVAVNSLASLRAPKPADTAQAEAQLAQVEATLVSAQQTAAGATPAQLAQARAQLASAQAALAQARQAAQGATPTQLAQAQAALAQAQAQFVTAQNAAAGPTAAQQAQAQAAVTQATDALGVDQAALAQAQAALAACSGASPTPGPSGAPAPTPACDRAALQLAVQQAQARVTTDQAQLTSAQAALAGLTSPESQAQAQAILASAQSAVNAAQAALDALTSGPGDTAQAQLDAAEAAATSAQRALDALAAGNPAQARAQLDAARAQVAFAQASLYALLHPTSQQLAQAQDQVSTAGSGLDAAKARLDAPRGVLTQLAAVGDVVRPGGILYTLDGSHPVLLLQGTIPAWRSLQAGVSDGADVGELEANLEALGFAAAGMTVDRHWDARTTAAVKAWQHSLGVPQTGVIPYGQIVFEPGPMRITANTATLGGTLQAGTAVLAATSTDRVVAVALDPSLQPDVKVGDAVSVTLPDGSTTPGSVSEVGTVATAGANSGALGGATPAPTIDMSVTLTDPSATGTLDQAPVTVNITTATATDVLAVPVGALVQLLEGGYAVQVEQGASLHYVAVHLGLFADGWVQVSGSGLSAGQTVLVAQ